MTISIAGVGYAGAGAYYDLLCEFESIEHTPNLYEFGIMYEPDGLIDLVNKLRGNNCKIMSYVPIGRFLHLAKFYNDYSRGINDKIYSISLNFINGLDLIYTKGFQYHELSNPTEKERIIGFINDAVLSRFNRLLHTRYAIKREREMLICMDIDGIEKKSKQYIGELLDSFRKGYKRDLLIKHICPPDMPEICLPYLPDSFRHISVNRDPRDLFILGRINNTNDFPCGTVQDFVKYYKAIRERQKESSKVKIVYFEDLCYRYNEITDEIKQFLSIDSKWNKGTCFHPEISINNTKLFLKYSQYSEDCRYIEKCIPQFLYDYK